jgi:predicted amidohydrolase
MPAKSIGRDDQIGTLRAGTTADVFVFEIETGDLEYADTHFQRKQGQEELVPFLTIKGGRIINPEIYAIKLRVFEHCDYEIVKYLKETA